MGGVSQIRQIGRTDSRRHRTDVPSPHIHISQLNDKPPFIEGGKSGAYQLILFWKFDSPLELFC